MFHTKAKIITKRIKKHSIIIPQEHHLGEKSLLSRRILHTLGFRNFCGEFFSLSHITIFLWIIPAFNFPVVNEWPDSLVFNFPQTEKDIFTN